MMLRSRKKNQNDVSLNDSIGTDKEGNAIMLMDVIENDDEDIFEEMQSGDRIKTLYKNIKYNLTPRERKIITLRYGLIDGKCLTQREIAKMLGISRSYISRIEKKAISKLGEGNSGLKSLTKIKHTKKSVSGSLFSEVISLTA